MSVTILEQLNSFIVFLISGIIIGVFFDIFRIIRRLFNTSDLHTYIEDILFGIITGIFLISIIFIYEDGNIRFYMFISLFLGLLIYWKFVSKYFIKINVLIFKFINKIIYKIMIYPLKFLFTMLRKIFNKPFMLFTINIRKFKEILRKYSKKKSQKMLTKKKDFNI